LSPLFDPVKNLFCRYRLEFASLESIKPIFGFASSQFIQTWVGRKLKSPYKPLKQFGALLQR
jgi:hypothetical protein